MIRTKSYYPMTLARSRSSDCPAISAIERAMLIAMSKRKALP